MSWWRMRMNECAEYVVSIYIYIYAVKGWIRRWRHMSTVGFHQDHSNSLYLHWDICANISFADEFRLNAFDPRAAICPNLYVFADNPRTYKWCTRICDIICAQTFKHMSVGLSVCSTRWGRLINWTLPTLDAETAKSASLAVAFRRVSD